MSDDNRKECFIISPIGETNSETRKRSDQVMKYIITPAVTSLGYRPLRADQISEPGIITKQVIQHIIESPLVIADLTDRNPNVFYELAIRHAIKKPVIQMIKKDNPIPFDVAVTRMIQFDLDVESVDNTKLELENQIRSIENDAFVMDNPISFSLNLTTLEQSDNPEQRSIANIISSVDEIKTLINERTGQLPSAQRDDEMHKSVIAVSRLAESLGVGMVTFGQKTVENTDRIRNLTRAIYQVSPDEVKSFLENNRLKVEQLTESVNIGTEQLQSIKDNIPGDTTAKIRKLQKTLPTESYETRPGTV